MNWLTDYKIPMGDGSELIVDWLKKYARPFFDTLSDSLEWMIDGIVWALQTPPALVVIIAFVALTWVLQRSWKTCVLVALCLLFIVNQGYWDETIDSLALVLSSGLVCMGLGVPIGIFLAHRPRAYLAISPVLDLMQTLPTFVYLIPAIVFFGLGMVPGLFATVIFVLPAPIRLTYLGIAATPTPLLEAAQAFGATRTQVLWKVELPSAMPQIMAGLNQVIAAYVGADGLGKPVVQALGRNDPGLGFESGFVIVAVAIMLDRMLRRKSK